MAQQHPGEDGDKNNPKRGECVRQIPWTRLGLGHRPDRMSLARRQGIWIWGSSELVGPGISVMRVVNHGDLDSCRLADLRDQQSLWQ
jgi:hypothetical protein